jgi:hypothetical protein
MALKEQGLYVQLNLTGAEDSFPTLVTVSSFLYDLNLLYEVLRLDLDPRFADFAIGDNVYRRNGRPLQQDDQLHVDTIKLGSPLSVVLVLLATPLAIKAFAALVQNLETIYDAPLRHRKLAAETEKAERENRVAAREELRQQIEDSKQRDIEFRALETRRLVENTSKRLKAIPIKVSSIGFEVVESRALQQSKDQQRKDHDSQSEQVE